MRLGWRKPHKWVGNGCAACKLNFRKLVFHLKLSKGSFRGLKHPPPYFYHEQARHAACRSCIVQVQLHFIHMYWQWKAEKSKENSNLTQELLILSFWSKSYLKRSKYYIRIVNYSNKASVIRTKLPECKLKLTYTILPSSQSCTIVPNIQVKILYL